MTVNQFTPPMKFYGPAILFMPTGIIFAKTRAAQIDCAYAIADDPNTPKHIAMQMLRLVKKLTT